ncbi:type IV secretory system conjugative DNA transfer family protein [Roseomonas sp. KE2513]|uniref:type IV secretory system conjugative DNA transfer family protein n=1 Tax=Roseomonas sp. KE2513 TaxID=2479202 RepID=UPI002814F9CD|nr:type IV secretory system conjugative DNA transfer family protein [Roseomonas sp. KE2513]
MSDRRLPSPSRLVAWGLLLAILALLWTAAASAVFLWGTGLVRYFPFQGVTWIGQWWSYALYAPPNPIVGRWLIIGAGVPSAFLGLVIHRLVQLRSGRITKPGQVVRGSTDNHGHAEWMSMKEARDRFPGPHPDFGGVVVGEAYRVDQDKVAKLAFDPERRETWGQGGKAALLVDPCKIGPTHSLVFAGSGGFKTVSAASTLVHWTGAAVVLDPSRELGPMLAAARVAIGHKVVSLEPGTPGGINVLDWIDVTHPLAETNVHAVVGWIFGEAEGGSSDADKFFRNWGKQLVACLLAHMLWDDTMPTAAKTLRTLRAGIVTPEDQMRDVLEGIHAGSNSPMARDIAGTIKKIVPETFSGIYGNATGDTAWLSVAAYADLVSGGAEGTDPSCCTAELTKGELTVFLQIPLKVLRDTPAVGRVLVGALLNALYEADGDVRGRVLFMLDEVRRLGPMKILEVARDAGRKYGITLQLLYQAEDQLVEQWGRQGRNAWFDSVSWRMYAAVQNTDTAKSVSDAAGGHSVMAESEGSNTGNQGKPLEAGSRSKGSSMNRHEMARALIRPDELMQDVRGDEAFVFARGSKPLRCGRAIYFRRAELHAAIEASRFHKQAAE